MDRFHHLNILHCCFYYLTLNSIRGPKWHESNFHAALVLHESDAPYYVSFVWMIQANKNPQK